MTQIFLLRHGEAEGNIYRRVQGQNDLPLTDRGREQVSHLTARFAEIPLAAVYASDYARARDTALAAAAARGLEVRTDLRLREMGFGCWENLPWGEVAHRWPRERELFKTDIARWSVAGSESLAALQARLWDFTLDMERRHPGEAVAAGTHGMAVKALLARVWDVPFEESVLPDNASVTLLEVENGAARTVFVNDISHLPERPYVPERGHRNLRYADFDLDGGRERYLDCYRDAWQIAHGSLAGFDAVAAWRSAAYRAALDPGSLTAALDGDDFAGVLATDDRRDRREGALWIAFFYLLPEYRGRHCGYQLLGQAVAHGRALGRKKLRLTVAPGNPAVKFYQKSGFRPAGTARGALEDLIVMEKAI